MSRMIRCPSRLVFCRFLTSDSLCSTRQRVEASHLQGLQSSYDCYRLIVGSHSTPYYGLVDD